MEGADERLTDTAAQKHTLSPPKRSHLPAVWVVATAWGGGQFNGGKGHRSQTAISGCGLNVSDSRLSAARGLCSFGGAYRSSTSGCKQFNSISAKLEMQQPEDEGKQPPAKMQQSSVSWFTILKGRECLRQQAFHLSALGLNVKSLFSSALKCVFFILVFLCSDSAVRWGQNKY